MSFYEKEKCPVCQKEFTDGDDIVTCPECGTPHHRECYNLLGHCCNEDKHGDDFEYELQTKKTQKSKGSVINEVKYYSPQSRDAAQQESGENQQNNNQQPFISPKPLEDEYKDSAETVEGKPVSDVAAVVLTNTKRFIPKFLKNSKFSWNWSAFIFGPYYMFFRKMYKQGILFMALSFIANLLVSGFYSEQLTEFYSYFYSNIATVKDMPSQEVMNEFVQLGISVRPAFFILAGVLFVLHIIAALFADRFYRKRVLDILKNVDQKLEEGGMFQQDISIFEGESKLTQKDLRRLYLGKMGGTNVFAPALAFIVLDLITSIISRL